MFSGKVNESKIKGSEGRDDGSNESKLRQTIKLCQVKKKVDETDFYFGCVNARNFVQILQFFVICQSGEGGDAPVAFLGFCFKLNKLMLRRQGERWVTG